jgi:hypothetical protein
VETSDQKVYISDISRVTKELEWEPKVSPRRVKPGPWVTDNKRIFKRNLLSMRRGKWKKSFGRKLVFWALFSLLSFSMPESYGRVVLILKETRT